MEDLKPRELEILERYGFDLGTFTDLRRRYLAGELSREKNIESRSVEPPQPDDLATMPERDTPRWRELEARGGEALEGGKVALAILNGGMATRFGGRVKGVVPVKGEVSFLQLKIEDTRRMAERFGGTVPILVMNSRTTHEATREHLESNGRFGCPAENLFLFNQFLFPRLTAEGEIYRADGETASFYGPGHGDFPIAMRAQGALEWLREREVEHVLMANVDNLGARVDPVVIGFHLEQEVECTAEMAPKWPGDQGGCPVRIGGKLQILEGFRFPEEFDQDQVEVFNSNTLTFRTDALDRDFPFTWFCVRKRVGKDEIIQFERLVGQVTEFLDCAYLVVPRTGRRNRFYPVKTPRDLEEGDEVIKLLYPEILESEGPGS